MVLFCGRKKERTCLAVFERLFWVSFDPHCPLLPSYTKCHVRISPSSPPTLTYVLPSSPCSPSTLTYVVPWSELPIVPSYLHHHHGSGRRVQGSRFKVHLFGSSDLAAERQMLRLQLPAPLIRLSPRLNQGRDALLGCPVEAPHRRDLGLERGNARLWLRVQGSGLRIEG